MNTEIRSVNSSRVLNQKTQQQLKQHTSYYHALITETSTFENRVGSPDDITSGLGHVIISFSGLEHSIEDHIDELASLTPKFVTPAMSGLDFKKKVGVLSNLVELQLHVRNFNAGDEDPEEIWSDFERMLLDCDKFRADFLHTHLMTSGGAYAGSDPGEPAKLEPFGLTGSGLIDISDYIVMVRNDLEEFLCVDDECLRPERLDALQQ